ncbi:MAG: hypothetical protein K1X89_20335 [Myxococcaceae bacterium]|nr:hypothetical protein [Myxococcaceae bacterium]
MSTAPSYEVSATYLDANLKALREAGHFDSVLAALSPELKAAAQSPYGQSWWPGKVNEGIVAALCAVHGEQAVEQVGFLSVQRSIGPLVMPFLRVLIAVTGADPKSVFSKLGQFSTSSTRGVSIDWKPGEGTRGEITVTYPTPVDPAVKALWRGGLRCGLTMLKREGRVDDQHVDARTLRYQIVWQ